MTFKECCEVIAKKYKLGKCLVTGHRFAYFEEAAQLFTEQRPSDEECQREAEEWVDAMYGSGEDEMQKCFIAGRKKS
jgi:hypothetical protein